MHRAHRAHAPTRIHANRRAQAPGDRTTGPTSRSPHPLVNCTVHAHLPYHVPRLRTHCTWQIAPAGRQGRGWGRGGG
eukprot:9152314-Pyramimonas_sp.AAC.2